MNFSFSNLQNFCSKLIGNLSRIAVVLVCATAVLASSGPAYAFGTETSSQSSDGVVQLDNVLDEARDSVQNESLDMETVQKKSRQGLNGVQGAADAEKMQKQANSDRVTTVPDDVKSVFKTVMDN